MDQDTSIVNTPTDGNPPAPILPQGTPLTISRPHPFEELVLAGLYARADVLKAKRSVHAGATSHDCEAA